MHVGAIVSASEVMSPSVKEKSDNVPKEHCRGFCGG